MALRRHVLALRLEWPFALSGIFLYLGYSVVVVDLLLLFFTLSELQNASAVKIIADNFVFKKKKKMSVDIFVKTYQLPGLRHYTARIAFVKCFNTSL